MPGATGFGWQKSNGVPATGATSPVGISAALTGVYRLALIITTWSQMSPSPSPFRLK